MKVIEFILTYWSDILLVILALVSLVYGIYKKDYAIVKKLIFSLVTEAEQAYGSGTGALKLSTVVNVLYPRLPKLFKAFVTEKKLVAMIESVLEEAKEKWETNTKLKEFVESKE